MILPIEGFIICCGSLINRTSKYTFEIGVRFSEEKSCAVWAFEIWRRIKISVL